MIFLQLFWQEYWLQIEWELLILSALSAIVAFYLSVSGSNETILIEEDDFDEEDFE